MEIEPSAEQDNNSTDDFEPIADTLERVVENQNNLVHELEAVKSSLKTQQHLVGQQSRILAGIILRNEVSSTPIYVKRISQSAIIPVKSTVGSVGFDLFAAENVTIKDNGII